MCILCVIQKWSRKVATMLPWLVIPLIGLWLLSQFLPPAFRFEITSPRLACVLVLLVTLFWYEILMPQLSSWRARRNARLKERKRLEAIEFHKLKKTAIRRCRNCRTPYRDQNPCGGRFSCSYCGHKSKRPEMDLYASPDGRFSNSGVLRDLVGKVWSDNNWICGQDWLENGGNWVNGSLSGKSSYSKKNNDYFFSFLVVFVFKSLAAIFLGIMWLFRKLFRISFDEDDTLSDSDTNGVAKIGENGVNCNETRSEKARRKAEEKRQARLERKQLEEEERKQREEVARLVEERRKLRDETDRRARDKNDKKEAERKRQERKKERDRGSSKSNSDVDELEKRASKEIEKNKKGENEQHRPKVVATNNYTKGSVGARYLDRMRGNFNSGGFFGKGTNAKASNTKEHRSLDHTSKRDFVQPERAHMKPNLHADDQNQNRPTVFESQPCPPPKRSWQQLFTRSSPAASSTNTNTNVLSRPKANSQTESQGSIAYVYPVTQGFDVPVTHGLPYPLPNYSYGNSTTSPTGLQLSASLSELVREEPNNFGNPLIGSVSESLDSFQLDLGFLADLGIEKPSPSPSPTPTPIASPMSRLWTCDEKTNLPMEDANDKGWQMWNSSPICPDTLGLVGGNPNWFSPQKNMLSSRGEDQVHKTNGFMHADDPWALRTHNELVYGMPNGPSLNHPFLGSVWAKKEKAGVGAVVEGIGTTSAMISPGGGGLYAPPDVQSLWAYE